MGDSAGDALLEATRRVYTSKKYTDVDIVCGEKTWKAHKLVLSANSEYFRPQCDGDWKEGMEGKIPLHEDDPQTIDAMLAFLYKGSYGDDGNAQADCEPMTLDARVFILADKTFIKPLKMEAAKQFAQRAHKEWGTPGFAAAIAEVYENGPPHDRALRDTIMDIICANAKELYGHPLHYADFHRVIDEMGDFAADVTRAMASSSKKKHKAKDEKTYKCPSCLMIFTIRTSELQGNTMYCPRACHSQSLSWWSSSLVQD